jgi:protein associated with RNAse G/E
MSHPAGTHLAIRGVISGGIWSATAATIVEDSPEQSILLVVPGCERQLATSSGHKKDGALRWQAVKSGSWDLVWRPWERTRVLWFLDGERYYSFAMFWDAATGEFINYYVNFQVPFTRSHAGFDTLDLDLDIIVPPTFNWHWKDEDDWEDALDSGVFTDAQLEGVESAKAEVVERIERTRLSHLDPWLDWQQPAEWVPARLPKNWQAP